MEQRDCIDMHLEWYSANGFHLASKMHIARLQTHVFVPDQACYVVCAVEGRRMLTKKPILSFDIFCVFGGYQEDQTFDIVLPCICCMNMTCLCSSFGAHDRVNVNA